MSHEAVEKLKVLIKKADTIVNNDRNFEMRRRFNSHHSAEQVKQETKDFDERQYSLFSQLKKEYSVHRDDLLLIQELSKGQKSFIDEMEKVLVMDMEHEIGLSDD